MELIRLNKDNIDSEHICCAISNDKDIQVSSKKSWLKERFDDGLVFLKCNVRGKCFIEYIPAQNAWCPIDAKDYMYIDCLWVSGQFKGHGYSNILLDECIKESKEKGKKGLVCLCSKKKMGFLSDPKYLRYKGFELADTLSPYFELMYLPFENGTEMPRFKEYLKAEVQNDMAKGFTVNYTNQCPFTAKYVPILEEIAKSKNIPFNINHIDTKQKAQSAPCPFTTFSLFYDGKFITHEIPSEKKFDKLTEQLAK